MKQQHSMPVSLIIFDKRLTERNQFTSEYAGKYKMYNMQVSVLVEHRDNEVTFSQCVLCRF